ncbi:PLP-dependent aminotransferase family protein [Vibrio sp. SM6]|uniref:PLP-dependent aminotransferase family protein n=1 Tax=Vibrio agarilyticus TaxID=2726741 RepID=A0A7X8TR40_9VIBR|nr:PLP-dependent aminotransferase family protein [Vibrio agarilyticus]
MSDDKFTKIAEIIEQKINSGEYLPNSKLPTHRALADELKTTPATIAKAYKLLSERGRLDSFVGRGTFVRAHTELGQAIQAPNDEKYFNFSLLQPCLDVNVAPLKKAYQQAAEQFSAVAIGYVEGSGHEAHREAGVMWAKEYGLLGGNSSNTLLTNGAQHALSLIIHSMTRPGDTILVEALTYPGILAIASLAGRQVVSVALDEQGLCPDSLQAALVEHDPTLVIVVPNHQNPTGALMSQARKKAIAHLINQHQVWLIEDDIYAFLNEAPCEPIANFAPDYTFHISALSKAISPAMRCGFIKAPQPQVNVLNAFIRSDIWLSSPLNFIAATCLIESQEAFRIAAVQRDIAKRRRQIAADILTQVSWQAHGYHIWLPLPQDWQADRFTMEAKNQGILVTSGSYFSADGQVADHVRLSLMSISDEARFKQGLHALQALLQTNRNTLFPF